MTSSGGITSTPWSLVGEMRCASLYGDYKAIYNKWFNEDPPSPEKCIAFKD